MTDTSAQQYDLAINMPCNNGKVERNLNTQNTYKKIKDNDLHEGIRKLSTRQRLLLDDVMLRKRLFPKEKISLFLSGGVGTGKTFLLLMILQLLTRHYEQSSNGDLNLPTHRQGNIQYWWYDYSLRFALTFTNKHSNIFIA